jgi:hypothetical protein
VPDARTTLLKPGTLPAGSTVVPSEPKFPRIELRPRDGSEPFHVGGKPLLQPVLTVRDFWSWACSDLVGNSLRGLIAEYLVARSVGSEQPGRVEWDAYDVLAPGGIGVEVKTSGYLQSWQQTRLSDISFDIACKRSWYADTNTYSSEAARSANVYVFALHRHQEKATVDPLDLSQWIFYVLPATVLNERCATKRTIGLPSLIRLGATAVEFEDLGRQITIAAAGANTLEPTSGPPKEVSNRDDR